MPRRFPSDDWEALAPTPLSLSLSLRCALLSSFISSSLSHLAQLASAYVFFHFLFPSPLPLVACFDKGKRGGGSALVSESLAPSPPPSLFSLISSICPHKYPQRNPQCEREGSFTAPVDFSAFAHAIHIGAQGSSSQPLSSPSPPSRGWCACL